MADEKRLIDANAYHTRLSKITMDELFPDWKELPRDTKDRVCKLAKEHERFLFDEPTVDCFKHGHWINIGRNYYALFSQCSECGTKYDFRSPYCPNCGAKMDGDGNA